VYAVPVAGVFLCAATLQYEGTTDLQKQHTVKALIT